MTKPILPQRYQKSSKPTLSGGYGLVEIWNDTSLTREVAVKWTAPEDAKQLLSEVRALSLRPSPFIVEIYDVVLDQGGMLRAVVLEYLTGNGFEKIDLSSPAQHPVALKLLYQMAQGLADLHAVSLVHRDVKPANAVCTADGRLKLVDFGLSSPGAGAETVEAKGTLGYAAPEFFGPKPVPISYAMDVFSFGMVCWEKLVGQRPPVGPTGLIPDSTYFPLSPIETKIKIPARLAKIINECLAWKPSDRPAMQKIADAFMAELTYGRHAACVMMPGSPPYSVTTAAGKVSSLKTPNGSLDIGYDGYVFTIRQVHGLVFVNNRPAAVAQHLHLGCLLTFGANHPRQFVPFRQSAPEIVF